MTRHVVIGTAGHVDHGKSALVKALTGIDTDRFPEEQRRGITIDIGFAHLQLDGEYRASVVDVPGHEDFIRNMVAGATGIDVALLVVAADEGVMPQTTEHLAILDALGIATGAVAITKADLADPDWLELVRADVAERLAATAIRWEPPVAVSAVTGQGLDQLRASLARSAARAGVRLADDLFRMPVDRVFSLPGAGTVITGTTWSGSVKVGDQVSVLPEGASGRVRSIQVHGESRERAEPGRRTALAMVGLERAAAGRGSVAVNDPSWRVTSSIDITLSLLPTAPRPMTQRTRLRLHLGTAEVIARLTPEHEQIAPGETGLARLRLESPVIARWGDRGVLRSYSPMTTIGGCLVVDPWPPSRPRRPVADGRRQGSDSVERVRGFVCAAPDGLAIGDLAVRAGIHAGQRPATVQAALERSEIVQVGDRLVPAAALERLRREALEALATYHRTQPLEPGMALELLRQSLRPAVVGEHVVAELQRSGDIVSEGGRTRLAGHVASLSTQEEKAGAILLQALASAGAEGRTLAELTAGSVGGSVERIAEYYVRQGTAIRVGQERYYQREALERLAKEALAEIGRLEGATPAQLRDKLHISRKYLIPLLEWLDLKGFTVRSADVRHLTAAGRQYVTSA
ncbi:MAG: selenocysteine-specific translation elongation factor [Gemmatimonadetes bacterium]|nr:selenocysteine-specific translation elongation factor [Gemmatimonadota bacterium]